MTILYFPDAVDHMSINESSLRLFFMCYLPSVTVGKVAIRFLPITFLMIFLRLAIGHEARAQGKM
jgi:hypothetical protein